MLEERSETETITCVVRHLVCRFKSQVVTSYIHRSTNTIQFPFFYCLHFMQLLVCTLHTYCRHTTEYSKTKLRFQTILNNSINFILIYIFLMAGMAPISICLCIFHKFTPLESAAMR